MTKTYMPLEWKEDKLSTTQLSKHKSFSGKTTTISEYSKFPLDTSERYILIDSLDSASLWRRELLSRSNVLGVLKRAFLDSDLYDEPMMEGRYHFNLIWEENKLNETLTYPKVRKELKLSKNLKGKLYLWNELLASPIFSEFTKEVDFDKERAIDVMFYGTTEYASPILRFHRKGAMEALRNLKGVNKSIGDGRQLLRPQYASTMRQSKIVVSPWGWGELCYRDFEALLSGAVLIKPNTDFITTEPNIFKEGWYLPCKVDFSDLQQVVEYALEQYPKTIEVRKERREVIIDYIKNIESKKQDIITKIKDGND